MNSVMKKTDSAVEAVHTKNIYTVQNKYRYIYKYIQLCIELSEFSKRTKKRCAIYQHLILVDLFAGIRPTQCFDLV